MTLLNVVLTPARAWLLTDSALAGHVLGAMDRLSADPSEATRSAFTPRPTNRDNRTSTT